MPKKLYKIPNFHGGLDETSSSVDMKNGFFTNLTDVVVDKMGQIVPMGDFDNAPTNNPTGTGFIVHSDPGYGLFAFNANRQLQNGTFGDCVIYVIQQYVSGDKGENFIFWDSTGNNWAHIGSGGDLSSSVLALDIQGAHTGADDQATVLTDSNANFIASALIGATLSNVTDGCTGTITANTATTITVDDLTGGTDNDWDTEDVYKIVLSGQVQPDFLAFDNVLRICDGNMSNIIDPSGVEFGFESNRGWVGYILRTHFPGSGSSPEDEYALWYATTTVAPAAPTRGYAGSVVGGSTATDGDGTEDELSVTNLAPDLTDFKAEIGASTGASNGYLGYIADVENPAGAAGTTIYWQADDILTRTSGAFASNVSGKAFKIFPPAGTGAILNLTASNSGGFLPSANYNFGITFVYDGLQDSNILAVPISFGSGDGVYTIGGSDVGSFTGSIHLTTPYNARISGMRIYYKYDQDIEDRWYLAWDVDFARGSRTTMSDTVYKEDTEGGAPFTRDETQDAAQETITHTLPSLTLPGDTYYNINGYEPHEDLDIRYKTSASVANFVYVANVYKSVGGAARHYPDRIWRCAFLTYFSSVAADVFPEENYISNPGVGGDPIVKLMALGNQLLAFGSDYLTVYTIAEQGETITGTYAGYGVAHPSQVVKTPNGIVFANNAGVYIYSGRNVTNLLHKRGNA